MKTIENLVLVIAFLAIGSSLLTGCKPREEIPQIDYVSHINNVIVDRCSFFRDSNEQVKESIRQELAPVLASYSGRIDPDAEYCLNTMEVPYNR